MDKRDSAEYGYLLTAALGILTGTLLSAGRRSKKKDPANSKKKIREQHTLIKELIAKNAELRKGEQSYHRLVAEVKDYAIFLLNKEGNIETWNMGAEKIKGYRAEEVIGKNFSIFYTPEDLTRNLPQQLLHEAEKTGTVSSEGWRMRKDGSRFWAHIVITAIHDDSGEVIGFSKVTHDVTDKMHLENQLKNYALQAEEINKQLSQSNKELESFTYIASHDLKEPLRKIQTFSHRLLEKETERLSENGKEYFQRIMESTLRMQQLIDDLLIFSRSTGSFFEFERVDLNQMLEEAKGNLKIQIEESKATIKANPLPVVHGVSFQMSQVFQNILSNAIKYRREEVTPKIKITADEVSGATIDDERASHSVGYIRISFRDNGIGFSQEYASRIFELFQRLHGKGRYSGSGVGLAICKKIIENHGGFIRARGKEGAGALFEIFIPDRLTASVNNV